jgi:hypothetical protein
MRLSGTERPDVREACVYQDATSTTVDQDELLTTQPLECTVGCGVIEAFDQAIVGQFVCDAFRYSEKKQVVVAKPSSRSDQVRERTPPFRWSVDRG